MKHAKLQKWGNSLAVRIPKTLVKELRLREGCSVRVGRGTDGIHITRAPRRQSTAAELWKKFLIPTGKKRKDRISENIDRILYGTPRR